MSTASPEDRARAGREARARVPPEAHADLGLPSSRDPLGVLADQEPSRLQDLLPVRYERMGVSPFTFLRGGAAVMAADLAATPTSGFDAQLCGDAHLANFGTFASPERALLFDVNDFDETCRGPWEWDVKRLAASLVVASRDNGHSPKQARKAAVTAVRRYRDAMASFAAMGNLAVWYARVDVAEVRRLLEGELDPRMRTRMDKAVSKARGRNHLRALNRLTEVVDGRRHIVADPPLLVPVADLVDLDREAIEAGVQEILLRYAASLGPGARELIGSYTFVDMARKVVGVGSVGTRCWVVLMRGRDDDDPLFLQVKEAQPSVLAHHLGTSPYETEGERVVSGQRVMQAASDIFLGWHRTAGVDGVERDFYVRQLQDWKGSADLATLTPKGMRLYAAMCASTLARAHARSGDRIAIAAYLGEDDDVAQAVADHAEAYADVTERDHAGLVAAVAQGGRLVRAGTPS